MGRSADDLRNPHYAFEAEACGQCGNFTLVRSGDSLKCDTCNSAQAAPKPYKNGGVEIAREAESKNKQDENNHPVLPIADAINL